MANTVSFTTGDYQSQIAEIERHRRLAEAMQMQGSQPIEQQTAGGWVVPISPWQGAAKLAQAFSGAYGQKKAGEREKQVIEEAGRERSTALAEALRMAKGSPGLAHEDGIGAQPAQAPDMEAALGRLAQSKDPMLSQMGVNSMLQRFMPKEPKWQVSERFNAGTGKQEKVLVDLNNPNNVLPFGGEKASELHFADTGPNIQGLDKYTGKPTGAPVTKGMAPGETARLNWDKYQWENISPYQTAQIGMEGARLANQGIETQYNTGRGVTGPVRVPGVPAMPFGMGGNAPAQPAPAAPARAAAPVVASAAGGMAPPPDGVVLPPRVAAEVAAHKAKQRSDMEGKREFNMGGLNAALDEAESILTKGKPTQSMVGAAADWLGSTVGYSPDGAKEADQLKSIGGALVAKMPRMEGPQSDKDVQLYREMAGQVGDNTLPVSRRLAALNTVRELYAKYEKGVEPRQPKPKVAGASGGWSITPIP